MTEYDCISLQTAQCMNFERLGAVIVFRQTTFHYSNVQYHYRTSCLEEIRSHIEYLIPNGNIVLLVCHLKLTNLIGKR